MAIRGLALTLWAAASWSCSTSPKARTPDWKKVPVSLELRLAEDSAAPGLVSAAVYGQGKTVYLHPEAVISKRDIARVEATQTRIGKGLVLDVWFTRAGAARVKQVTGSHVGDRLAVLIDSVVLSVPRIQQAIGGDPRRPSGIGVPLEPKEAQQLAAAIAKTWPRVPARSRPEVGN
jgi:preprotein translocase subunit SecD